MLNLTGVAETLVDNVRLKLADNTPSERRWSDEEVLAAVNTGEREVARRTYDIRDSSTSAICTVTIEEDVATYDLSTKVLYIERMECSYDGYPLSKRTIAWLDEERKTWKVDEGMPDFVEGRTSFTVTPIPTDEHAGYYFYLTVVRLPLLDLSESNATPEVHEKFYEDIEDYACYKLKMKRDADTFDPEGAMGFYALFEKSVGARPDANIERVIKEEPSGLRIQVRL